MSARTRYRLPVMWRPSVDANPRTHESPAVVAGFSPKYHKCLNALVAAICGLVILLLSGDAVAVPAFARAYRVPCNTCHLVFPRRAEFGDAFRKAGYRWPGDPQQDLRARNPKPIEMSGVSGLSGFLPTTIPLGVTAAFSATLTDNPEVPDLLTVGTPSFNFLFGSTFGNHISVFGTWAGQGAPNELYLHIARLGNRPEINARIGQLEQTTTMYKNNEAAFTRFTLSSSALSGHSVGQGRLGAELNGVLFGRTFYAVGAVKNGGLGSKFDGYYHLEQKIGGMSFLGEEPDVDLDDPTLLDDIHLTVAHWGYFGTVTDNTEEVDVARIRRFGAGAKLGFPDFWIWSGAMVGQDRNHLAKANNPSLTWFVEADYALTSWLHMLYIYQYQDAADMKRESQRHDIGAIFLPLENLRARMKYSFIDDDMLNETVEAQLLLGF